MPRSLASEVAALVEPLACCLHGVERAEVREGQTVAVLGAGPIGLMLCACIADAGAQPVLVGGRAQRRALAPGLRRGARRRRGRRRRDRGDRHAEGLARRGRARPPRRHGRRLRRPAARTEVALDARRIHYEELTLRGAFHHTPRTVRAALAFLASGAWPWERLLTHEVSLEGLPALFAEPPDGYLKAIVRP